MSHNMLLSTLYIMWPLYLQTLKFLCPTIKREMYWQESAIFDLWPCGQGHMKCCLVFFTSNYIYTCKVWRCYVQRFRRYLQENTLLTLDPKVNVTQNIAQYFLQSIHICNFINGWYRKVPSLKICWNQVPNCRPTECPFQWHNYTIYNVHDLKYRALNTSCILSCWVYWVQSTFLEQKRVASAHQSITTWRQSQTQGWHFK